MAANKLTTRIVRRILADLDRSMPISVVAKKYRISVPMVWMIDRRKFWAHVPRPSDREPTEDEVEAMLASRFATMPGR